MEGTIMQSLTRVHRQLKINADELEDAIAETRQTSLYRRNLIRQRDEIMNKLWDVEGQIREYEKTPPEKTSFWKKLFRR